MLTIGEFSRLCMVTTKTLRHYDRIGLLVPAAVNPETGYRYYKVEQLSDMFFIQKCKEYGFTLEETAELLCAPKDQVGACFASRHKQIGEEIVHWQKVQADLLEDMKLLKKGTDIMNKESRKVALVETKDFEMVSERDVIAVKDFDALYQRLRDKLKAHDLVCTGGILAIYHCEEFEPEHTDAEIGAIVAEKSAITRTVPGGLCAMTVHHGAYQTLNRSYAAVVKWIGENGYRIAGQPYEKYLNSPHDVPQEKLMTEIYFPIKK